MATQRIDAHRPLLDQQLAGLVKHQHGLLIGALDRHEPHVGARHRLTDRRRIERIVLAPLDIGLDVAAAISPTSCPIAASSRAR